MYCDPKNLFHNITIIKITSMDYQGDMDIQLLLVTKETNKTQVIMDHLKT